MKPRPFPRASARPASSGRIAAAFARAASENRAAFIPYLTAGDPDLETTAVLARVLEESGSDILELGVPFSDPIADGPVIQRAASRGLASETTLEKVLETAARIRRETSLALVLFTYLNPLLRFGFERAAREASAAGVDGVLVTDLPPEEAPAYQPLLRAGGLDTIFLVSPTSPSARMAAAGRLSSGFLYVVSRSGITGARTALAPELEQTVRRARRQASGLPLAVGFGISTPEAARQTALLAEGVVVGSALVRVAEQARAAGKSVSRAVGELSASLARACAKTGSPGEKRGATPGTPRPRRSMERR
ncbi:MAG: tryptophan synthase subunit alpha [Acidobacteria bacterium]|nr:tryptophan synthase subunit alpha [Acidobacteriota bacterium]MCA1612235.1 tryptophan synthase subunit alpha [Acidobacteriota bacterium]